jgi:hypothetical protein
MLTAANMLNGTAISSIYDYDLVSDDDIGE